MQARRALYKRSIYRFRTNGKLSISGVPRRSYTCCTRCDDVHLPRLYRELSAYCSRPIAIAEPRTNVYLGTYLPHCLQRCVPIVPRTYTIRRINNAAHAYALNLHVSLLYRCDRSLAPTKKQFLNAHCRPPRFTSIALLCSYQREFIPIEWTYRVAK